MIFNIRTWLILIFVIVGSVALPRRVYASMIYTPNAYGLTARGMGMANALTGDHEDLSTNYYNPGGLGVKVPHAMGAGYIYTLPRLEGGMQGGQRVKQQHSNQMVFLHIRTDLGELFKKELPPIGLGFNLAVDDNFKTMMIFDDMRTYKGEFSRYGQANFVLQAALGVGVTKWMGLGLGFHGGFKGHGMVETRTSVAGNSSNQGTKMRASLRPSFLAGMYFYGDAWGLGLTYREETRGTFDPIKVTATPTIDEAPFPTLYMNFNFFDTYVPRQVWIGTHVDITDSVTLNADFGWRQWSQYEKEIADENWVGHLAEFDTIDLFTPKVGVEGHPTPQWAVRGGYRYEQTPFRTIGTRFPMGGDLIKGKVILDNDTHVMTTGTGYTFDSREFFNLDVTLDFAYQYHYFVPREAHTSEGYTYESEGDIHLLTAGVEVAW